MMSGSTPYKKRKQNPNNILRIVSYHSVKVFDCEGKKMIGVKHNRPRLLLGYADSAHASQCARYFRRQGWEVHLIPSGVDTRRLALENAPRLVILDTELPDESGWLTAAKILLDRPEQKIFLVGPERTASNERFASFLGAAGYLARDESPMALAEEVLGNLMPASA
jgi:ActR/RegA family two-component response regulator